MAANDTSQFLLQTLDPLPDCDRSFELWDGQLGQRVGLHSHSVRTGGASSQAMLPVAQSWNHG
jgi:hypothetical protein